MEHRMTVMRWRSLKEDKSSVTATAYQISFSINRMMSSQAVKEPERAAK